MTESEQPSLGTTSQACGDQNTSQAEGREKKEKRRGRQNDSPDVQLSKTLSYILRHGALKEGLTLRVDGSIELAELLKRPKLKAFTIDDIHRVVAQNEKQRFTIVGEKQSDGTIKEFIRANQGHSLKVEKPDLREIEKPSEIPTVVHGTYYKVWDSISREGLKCMGRTHIHFAQGLLGEDGVISGMRASCDVFIYLDVEKCFKDNIKFFISPNGVILSEGIADSKSIPRDYFKRVVDKNANLLYPTGGTDLQATVVNSFA